MNKNPESIGPNELPEVIASYVKAHQVRDLDVAIDRYATDASVTDEGRTYRGPEEIRAWLSRSASEFTYSIEATGTTRVGADHCDVMRHVEGNFPGGMVDLHFRFKLRDAKIAQLAVPRLGQSRLHHRHHHASRRRPHRPLP